MKKKQRENIFFAEEERNIARKKRYVKPRLEAVMLFADEVLGLCKFVITDCNTTNGSTGIRS